MNTQDKLCWIESIYTFFPILFLPLWIYGFLLLEHEQEG